MEITKENILAAMKKEGVHSLDALAEKAATHQNSGNSNIFLVHEYIVSA